MNGYVCFYQGKRIEVYAETLYKAKEQAIAQLRVQKAKEWLVSVTLAEKDGVPVIHVAAN